MARLLEPIQIEIPIQAEEAKKYLISFPGGVQARVMCFGEVGPVDEITKWNDPAFSPEDVISVDEVDAFPE